MFGRKIEGERVAYWGARAIYMGCQSNYHVDLLADRQGGDNVSDGFLYWLNHRALPWLRAEVKRLELGTDDDQVLSLTEYKYHLEACTNRSYGYLYIGAVERPVTSNETWENSATGKTERILVTGDKRLVWGVDHDVPEPGTRGIVRINDLGPCVLVGYQDEQYTCPTARLLNLRVKLDSPPNWWVKQTKARDLATWIIGPGRFWLKRQHLAALDESPADRKRSTAEFLANMAPSRSSIFSREGMVAYRKWKEKYELPDCICWDGDFEIDTPAAV